MLMDIKLLDESHEVDLPKQQNTPFQFQNLLCFVLPTEDITSKMRNYESFVVQTNFKERMKTISKCLTKVYFPFLVVSL